MRARPLHAFRCLILVILAIGLCDHFWSAQKSRESREAGSAYFGLIPVAPYGQILRMQIQQDP